MRLSATLLLLVLSIQSAFAQSTKPAEIPTSAKDRKPHPATQPDEVLDISLAELGNFDFDPDGKDPQIPADVKALSGVTVKLHGHMIPLDQTQDIKEFALIPSLKFDDQHAPKIQQTIVVTCPKDKSDKYCPDEIIVQGKLTVGIVKDDGFIISIFEVGNADVKPATR